MVENKLNLFFFSKYELDVKNNFALSTLFASSFLLVFLLVIGLHLPLTLYAQFTGMAYKMYLVFSPFILLLSIGTVLKKTIDDYKHIEILDSHTLLLLIALGIIGATLSLITNRYDPDDYYYIPNAVYFLENLDAPMDFALHFYRRLDNEMIISYNQATSLTYEYVQSAWSYYLGIGFLDVYYLYSVAIAGFLVPIANYLLMTKFTKNTASALAGAVISLSLLLILTEIHRTYGNFAFPRLFQGKAVMLSVGIPTFVAFSMDYFHIPSRKSWLILLIASIALVGLTATAALLIPIPAAVLFVAAWRVKAREGWKFFSKGIWYISATGGALLYLAVLYVAVQLGNTIDPHIIPGDVDFWRHIRLIFNFNFPLTPIAFLLFSLSVFFLSDWQRTFVFGWIFMILVFFLNPLAAKIHIGRTIPPNIYWRLLYIYPFPLVAGLFGAEVWSFFEKKDRKPSLAFLSYSLVFLFSLFGYLNHFHQSGQIGLPVYKLLSSRLELARKVVAVAPDGVMLAPQTIYGFIPMLTSGNPQVRMREDSYTIVEEKEYLLTLRASEFAETGVKYKKQFLQILPLDTVDVVVINSKILDGDFGDELRFALQNHGYYHQARADIYIVFWK